MWIYWIIVSVKVEHPVFLLLQVFRSKTLTVTQHVNTEYYVDFLYSTDKIKP